MKSKYVKLNVILAILIIFLVLYFSYLSFKYEEEKEGFAKKVKKLIKKATKPMLKKMTSQINKIETKMKKTMEKSIKKATKPIMKIIGKIEKIFKKALAVITKQLKAITKIVTKVIKGIKSGIVDPLINAFKYIGLMFAQLGLMIKEFFVQFSRIPTCVISYITWTVIKVKDLVIKSIIVPISVKILKKIFGRFLPSFIKDNIKKILMWFINMQFYLLSLIGTFFGINKVFYDPGCFSFDKNLKKYIDRMKKNLKKSGNSFSKFGKFKF